MAKIFVSYARESAQAVRSLATDVEALEHAVWFDGDLSGGKAWWDQILAQIRDCQVFMVALSPESLDSIACKRELGYAADLGKPVLPILIAEGVALQLLPPKLSQIHYVDYRNPDRGSAFKLARALSALPAAPAIPDPLPEPPAPPVSYIGGIAEQIANATSLTDKDQSALLVDLRRSLRDRETAADGRKLLERLRKRDDLLAKIGDEIDDLLSAPATATPPPPAIDRPSPAAQGGTNPLSVSSGGMTGNRSSPSRLATALAGAIIYAVLGGVAMIAAGENALFAVIPAIGGAIAGAIAKTDKRAIALAVVCGLIASFSVIYDGGSDRDILSMIGLLALPGGAILGVVLAVVIGKVIGLRGAT